MDNSGTDVYDGRDDCKETISCYMFDLAIPNGDYDYWKADGAHVYLDPADTYPAWTNGLWIYTPPGTTTRVARADFGVKYLRMRGATGQPYMFTGIWRPTHGDWAEHATFTSDVSNHWNAQFASGDAGPHAVTFGFYTLGTVSIPAWRDAYMGAAIVELTDPEAPTITSQGVVRPDGGDPNGWVSDDTEFWVQPTATDPGLGVNYLELTGAGVPGGGDYLLDLCSGTKADPCPSSLTHPESFRVYTDELPEGDNHLTLRAEDVLGQHTSQTVHVRVDRGAPGLQRF